jgi:hypothetical protein
MNTIQNLRNRSQRSQSRGNRFSLQPKLDAKIEAAKASIRQEFRPQLAASEHLLDLALNEAEALAWDTGFPHLVFPTLAKEKAEALSVWHARQQRVRQYSEQHFAA